MTDTTATIFGHVTLLAGVIFTAVQNNRHKKQIDQVHVLVNGRAAELAKRVTELTEEVAHQRAVIAKLQAEGK